MKDKVTTPWGEWEVLLSEKNYKVKRIKVFPGHRLSYQRHFKRDEHWVIVEGEGVVTLNGREIILKKGGYIDIPKESFHRIANRKDKLLVFIEVQMGECLENDIERAEDDYGRV